jgi:hypothetical protein
VHKGAQPQGAEAQGALRQAGVPKRKISLVRVLENWYNNKLFLLKLSGTSLFFFI